MADIIQVGHIFPPFNGGDQGIKGQFGLCHFLNILDCSESTIALSKTLKISFDIIA